VGKYKNTPKIKMQNPFKKFHKLQELDRKFLKNMAIWRIFKTSLTPIVSLDFSKCTN